LLDEAALLRMLHCWMKLKTLPRRNVRSGRLLPPKELSLPKKRKLPPAWMRVSQTRLPRRKDQESTPNPISFWRKYDDFMLGPDWSVLDHQIRQLSIDYLFRRSFEFHNNHHTFHRRHRLGVRLLYKCLRTLRWHFK
jgi:hypothetical protein